MAGTGNRRLLPGGPAQATDRHAPGESRRSAGRGAGLKPGKRSIARRTFCGNLLATLVSYSLVRSLVTHDLFAGPVKPIVDHWAIRLNHMCRDLKRDTIEPADWQDAVESLLRRIELRDLLEFIDFDRLTRGFEFPDLGAETERTPFPRLAGLPEELACVTKIFGLSRGRAIIDPLSGEKLADGSLRVRKLDVDEALRRYGKEMHH